MYGGLHPLACASRHTAHTELVTLPSRSIILIARMSIIGKSIIVTHRQACLFNLTECKLVDCASLASCSLQFGASSAHLKELIIVYNLQYVQCML